MSIVLRKYIPLAITFVVGVLLASQYVVKQTTLSTLANTLKNYGVIVAAFAILVGTGTLIVYQFRQIRKKTAGEWYLGYAVLISLALMGGIGILLGTKADLWNILTTQIYNPAIAALAAVAGYYFISASYRAFKIRQWETAGLIAAGVLVIFKNAPFGEAIWAPFGPIGDWIMKYLMTNVERALLITISSGIVVIAVKTLLGWQKVYTPGEE